MDVRPIQGTFQIAGARIIAPGDPSRSVLYYRVSKLGGGRMPRVGSDEVDVRAVRMLHDWIAAMPANGQGPRGGARGHPRRGPRPRSKPCGAGIGPPAEARSAAIRRLTSSTRGALLLLDLVDRGAGVGSPPPRGRGDRATEPGGRGPRPVRAVHPPRGACPAAGRRRGPAGDPVAPRAMPVAAARSSPTIPPPNARPATGSATSASPSGRTSRRSGPSTTAPPLLDQILEPSRTIEPPVSVLPARDEGRAGPHRVDRREDGARGRAQGLAGQDGPHPRRRGRADSCPQARSLMPELLLRDLTAQQVADLLEYLNTLR